MKRDSPGRALLFHGGSKSILWATVTIYVKEIQYYKDKVARRAYVGVDSDEILLCYLAAPVHTFKSLEVARWRLQG